MVHILNEDNLPNHGELSSFYLNKVELYNFVENKFSHLTRLENLSNKDPLFHLKVTYGKNY